MGGAVSPSGGGGAGGFGGTIATAGAGAGGSGGDPGCPPTATLAPGQTLRTIDAGGLTRTYILHVPASYTGTEPVPLLLDFHPLFGTGAQERDTSGYLAQSEQHGFIVAFPDGIDNAWNVGPCCTMSRAVDDLAFARAMVSEISAEGCIDARRVYAAGYSMGGGMSYHLACNAADMIAAIAPAAFDLLEEAEQPCSPSRPISVLASRGTADLVVPYAGGASNPPNGLPVTIHFQGAEGTFEHWRALDGCTDAPTTMGACATSTACTGGVEVTLCTTVLGGHDPGDATLGWDFLSRFSLP
jgi:polyhydroxybutyrate depolymerase